MQDDEARDRTGLQDMIEKIVKEEVRRHLSWILRDMADWLENVDPDPPETEEVPPPEHVEVDIYEGLPEDDPSRPDVEDATIIEEPTPKPLEIVVPADLQERTLENIVVWGETNLTHLPWEERAKVCGLPRKKYASSRKAALRIIEGPDKYPPGGRQMREKPTLVVYVTDQVLKHEGMVHWEEIYEELLAQGMEIPCKEAVRRSLTSECRRKDSPITRPPHGRGYFMRKPPKTEPAAE